jgi:hypothetical protein
VAGSERCKGYLTVRTTLAIPFTGIAGNNRDFH